MTDRLHRTIFLASITTIILFCVITVPLHFSKAPTVSLGDNDQQAHPQVLGAASPIKARNDSVTNPPKPPTADQPISLDPVSAKSILIYDVASDKTLAERNTDFPLPIASLTKLMTAYVAYSYSEFTEPVTVTGQEVLNISPILGLQVGDTVTVGDLFNSMLIGSANDAASTLASYISEKTGKKFPNLMNETAAGLHMTDTHFSNPMGFDSDTNYSTAADLKQLVSAAKQYQAFSLMGRKTSYSFSNSKGGKYNVKATNKLLTDPEISAIKTGFTNEALGSMITEITHDNHSFIIIIVGSSNREQDTLYLKRAVIKNYRWEN